MINVYLISAEIEGKKVYKIGFTRRDISKRIKEFKTGNASEFSIVDSFKSKWGTKIESILHKSFDSKKIDGEWFNFTEEDIQDFRKKCELIHQNLQTVSETSYFQERGKF